MPKWYAYGAGAERGRARWSPATRCSPTSSRHDRARAQRRARRHRRPVRRDQGAARRLLPRSTSPTSTRRSTGPRRCRTSRTARSRCGRSMVFDDERGDASAPRSVASRSRPSARSGRGARHADPPARRRLPARRGRAAGRLRRRARHLAARRRAGQRPGAWITTAARRRAIDRLRRERALQTASSAWCDWRSSTPAERRGRRRGQPVGRRRPPAPDLHVLPPGARAAGAGGADAALARRADAPPRSRARSSSRRRRWRSGSCAPSARSRRARSPTACRATRSCPTAWTACSRSSTWSSTRATRRRPATRSCAATCAPRRSASAACWPS